MTPDALKAYLATLVQKRLPTAKGPVRFRRALMIWGPPGIGKSSVVKQVADEADIDLIDVRISQLAPTDLRGVPSIGDGSDPYIPNDGKSHWLPPEFLPRKGAGILFLDELNMAPPAVQGIAQQLVLDRKVGDYVVPPDWYIWAAGNRKTDTSAVFDMAAPLANRFLHFHAEPHLPSFLAYAKERNLDPRIGEFLKKRPQFLHNQSKGPEWPSPRTWEMASQLLQADLPIHSAVGIDAAVAFGMHFKGPPADDEIEVET
jgi:MoxR-like ATPase